MGLMDTVYLRQKLDILKIKIQKAASQTDKAYNELLQESQELEAEARRLNIPEFIAVSLMRQSDILSALNQYDQAINILNTALGTLGDKRKQDIAVYILGKLAEIYAHFLNWEKVSSVCQQGIKIVEKYRYNVNRPYLQSAYLRFRISLYTLGILAAYQQENYPLILTLTELSKCRFALQYQNSSEAASDAQEETSEKLQEICQEIDRKRELGTKIEPLLVKRRQLWDLLMSQRFQAHNDQSLLQFTLEVVQDILDEDEAIIYYYWIDKNRLLIITIDRKDVIPELKTISENEKIKLEEFSKKALIIGTEQKVSEDKTQKLYFNERSFKKTLKQFSNILLPEKNTVLLNQKKRLLISPHRLLHVIPFNFLTWNQQFLIERFAITYIPNLSSLLLSYSLTKYPKILAIGNAEYQIPERNLPPLKQAEKEVEEIQKIYKTRSICVNILKGKEKGKEATLENLRKLEKNGELKTYSCLHFSIHGNNIESDTPMESHLFLRDSLLDGLEISNWDLKADTVILSACNSGQRAIAGRGMKELPGDDLFGLQAAFFTTGVKRIISTLWEVDSNLTVPITKDIHEFLANGKSPDIALQNALKSYLKTKGKLAKISQAAPFLLVTIGRPI